MKYHFQKVIVIGASRGIGAAVAEHITSSTNSTNELMALHPLGNGRE